MILTYPRKKMDPSQVPKPSGLPDVNTLFQLLGAATLAAIFNVLDDEKKRIGWRRVVGRIGMSITAALMLCPVVLHSLGDNPYVVMAVGAASGTFTEMILRKIKAWIEERFPVRNTPDECPPTPPLGNKR